MPLTRRLPLALAALTALLASNAHAQGFDREYDRGYGQPYGGSHYQGAPQNYGQGHGQNYGQGYAQPYSPAYGWERGYTPAYQQKSPEVVVREGLDKLAAFLKSGQGNPQVVRTFLEREIAPYFDLQTMARWSTGPAFRHLDPQQREQLVSGIGRLFFTAMAQKINDYGNGAVRFTTQRGRSRDEGVTVAVQASGYNRPPIELDFRLYQREDGSWRVYDVAANGQSAVVYYRQFLNRLIRDHGLQGALDTLASY